MHLQIPRRPKTSKPVTSYPLRPRSAFSAKIPKYCGGFDLDRILEKWYQGEKMTDEERSIFYEAVDFYYLTEFQKTKEDGFIPLLKIHDKPLYPTIHVKGTPYWKSVFPDPKPLTDGDIERLRVEIAKLEAELAITSTYDPEIPRYYEDRDMDEIALKKKTNRLLSEDEKTLYSKAWNAQLKKEHHKRGLAFKIWDEENRRKIEKNPLMALAITRHINMDSAMRTINSYVRDQHVD